jgi:hypothetical protein
MTLLKYKLEGTNGVTITAGNSGSPALSLVTSSGGASAIYDTASAFDGTTGGKFASDGSNAAYAQAPFNASCTQGAVSVAVKIPASTPAADYNFLNIRDTSGALVLSLVYRSGGSLVAADKASVYSTILTAAQATAGTFFRVELVVTALSATAGAYTARAYNSAGTQVGSTVNVTTANTGTTAMSYVRFGSTSATAFTISLDSVQTSDGATTEIGRLSGNTTPPTIAAIADQTFTANGTVTLPAVGTAYNGDTVSSYSWTCTRAIGTDGTTLGAPTLTGGTTANPTFSLTTKGRYEFSVTCQDSSGNVSAPQTARVFYGDTKITPILVQSNAGWSLSAIGNLSDVSDATYADSGASGSGNQLIVVLAPILATPTSFQLDIRSFVQAVGGTQQVELLDSDGTLRKNWGALGPGTSFADQLLNLTSGEIATITNWNALQLRLTQV